MTLTLTTPTFICTASGSLLALLFAATGCSGGTTVTDTGNTQDVAVVDSGVDTGTADQVNPTDVPSTDVPATDAPVTDTVVTDAPTAPTCAAYCDAVMAACTMTPDSAGEIPLEYATRADCLASCAAFPLGTTGDTTGNTIACRIYHAGAAAQTDGQDPHCWHAGPAGLYDASGCGTSDCESFCLIVLHSCTGANAQYGGSMTTCMTACATFSDVMDPSTFVYHVPNDAASTPLGCRLYHATAASTNPGLHCGHTAVVSSVCP